MAPVVDDSRVEEVVVRAAGRPVGWQREVVVLGCQQAVEVVVGWQQAVEVAVGCHPRVVGHQALLV